jgi:tetratricopeptide (TPR) repeat protein
MLLRFLIGLAAVLAWTTPAFAAWHEVRSKHFIIYADTDPDEIREYATKLERFDQAVRIARNMADPPLTDAGKLTIYALKDVRALDRAIGTGGTIYGIYLPRATGLHAFVAMERAKSKAHLDADIVFFHEYAHHLMLQNTAAHYPPWLIEGFAELLSTAVVADDGSVTFGAAANHRSSGVFALDHDLTLSAMVGNSRKWLGGWQQELVYARGWLLTHYLTFEPSRKGQLERYVAAIQSGEDASDAAKAAFGDLLTLTRELDRYATRKTLTGMVVETDASKIGSIAVRPLRDGEAAIMPVRMSAHSWVERATAARIAGRARKVAAEFSSDATVLSIAAEAENNARQYSNAIALADRALAIDPSDRNALIQKGRALLELAKENPAAANWDETRALIARANRADTEDPEPLLLYYRSYSEAGAPPPASAIKGLLYAVVLAPQDDKLRMTAVRQLLADGRLAEARQHFMPIALDPHGSEEVAAEDVLDAIDRSDGATSLSLVDSWLKKKSADEWR